MNEVNVPKCTSYILDIFRNHTVIGSAVELGSGLNPFSVICSGHPNTKDVLQLAEKQSVVESGASLTLQDASQFKTKDARFPRTYLQASDKLLAFVCLLRCYLGDVHPMYTAILREVTRVCPLILSLESVFHVHPRQGNLVAIRVLLYFQNVLSFYLRQARDTPTTDVLAVPDLSKAYEALLTQSYDGLPRVPDVWMELIKTQNPDLYVTQLPNRIRGGGPGDGDSSGGSTPPAGDTNRVENKNPIPSLRKHWEAAKTAGVKLMTDLKPRWTHAGEYEVPKDNGAEVCLNYHFRGVCKKGCKRAGTHKSYSPTGDMATKLHQHLEHCGVARP
jgi:hypothetical protein